MQIRKTRKYDMTNRAHNASRARGKSSDIVSGATIEHDMLLRCVPEDIKQQNKLGNELMIWSLNSSVYCIEDFPLSKLFSPTEFYKIKENNKYFAWCLDFAKHTIGSRMVHEWRAKTLDREYTLRLLPLYNNEYKEYCLGRTKAQSEGSASKSIFNIILDAIADSSAVKKRIDD